MNLENFNIIDKQEVKKNKDLKIKKYIEELQKNKHIG
jgi:hypothetical protein